jgi:hypothetical protein
MQASRRGMFVHSMIDICLQLEIEERALHDADLTASKAIA